MLKINFLLTDTPLPEYNYKLFLQLLLGITYFHTSLSNLFRHYGL